MYFIDMASKYRREIEAKSPNHRFNTDFASIFPKIDAKSVRIRSIEAKSIIFPDFPSKNRGFLSDWVRVIRKI